MNPPLFALQDVALTFGGASLFDSANLAVGERDRICIVGRNGSGKSTLMKIAAGFLEADRGSRFLQPGVTVRYLPQEPDFGTHKTVLAYVESGLGPSDDPYAAHFLLKELGMTGDEKPQTLSGGEARRAALARTLAPNPDILLLDEPTNHLDIEAIEWLEETLRPMRSAIVLISHDRRFLTNLSRKTVWIDRGKTRIIEIGFGGFEAWRDETLAQEELELHKLSRKIEREGDWLRYGVTARRKRNVKRLAALGELREKRRTAQRAPGQVKIATGENSLSGKLVIETREISKSFGENPIINKLSLRIHRGDRIGIVGPNGAGKTTLLNLLIGKLQPDEGAVRLGSNLDIASLEQSRESLKPEWTVADALTGGGGDTVVINGQPKHVASYMQDFLFVPEQIRTPVKVLSGGERARLMLARAFAKPSNLLVLDEPTNDLDLDTLDVLEEILSDYSGTIILISHDRDFLDRVVTSVIAPEENGVWIEYAGGYSDMLAQRGQKRLTPKANRAEKRTVIAETESISAADRAGSSGAKQKRRLSFNDKHALQTLPNRIAQLEKSIRDLQGQLSDPTLYSRDRDGFKKASAALLQSQQKLAEAENQWLELEILSEELGN